MTTAEISADEATRIMAADAKYRVLYLNEIHESPLNTRRHFDPAQLDEMAESIAQHGVLTPVLVRPRAEGGYELAAGHRRRRAAIRCEEKTGQVITVPAIVREMDDTQFLEVIVIENGQRVDVHPLEEAEGYKRLMESATGYNIKRVADRIGRPVGYVYDRLRLLQLTPDWQALFLADRIQLGHAVILARLLPSQQQLILDREAAFEMEGQLFDPTGADDPFDDLDERDERAADNPLARTEGMKAVTPRELQAWIDRNIRFEVTDEVVADLFPDTVASVEDAISAKKKIVAITFEYHLADSARSDEERTLGPRAFKVADGSQGNPTCEHAVLGVIKVGFRRGETLDVCIAKKKCAVHWKEEIKRAATAERAAGGDDHAKAKLAASQAREEAKRAKEDRLRERWAKAIPAVRKAIIAKMDKMPATVTSPLGVYVLSELRTPRKVVKGTTAESIVRAFAVDKIQNTGHSHWYDRLEQVAKHFGVNTAAILDEVAPDPDAPAKPKAKDAAPTKGKGKAKPAAQKKRAPAKKKGGARRG